MQIKIIAKEKDDRNPNVKLIVTIYENDYRNLEHDRDVSCPLINNYSALLRVEFTNSALYVSVRRNTPSNSYTVRLHVRCEQLDFANTFTCPRTWSDWIKLGKLPRTETSSSDGKMHILKIHLNICELRNKTFVNLLDDKFFYDVYLVSDGSVPANVAMHRAVLSAHSGMFKSMLLGEWKDALDVKIKIKDASHQTLLDLREYLYLGILPDKNLVELMEVAKKYRFENLLADCVFEMVNVVDSQNLLEYRQFAIDYHIPELLNALDYITTDELVKTAYRLEMLKVSQVKGKSCVKNTDTQRNSHTQRRDSNSETQAPHTPRRDSHRRHPQRQDSDTQRSHSQRQDSDTQRSHSQRQDSDTHRRHSQRQDSHTQKKDTNTQKKKK